MQKDWILVPNVSVGPFVFGTPISAYVAAFGARQAEEPDGSEKAPSDWLVYNLPDSDAFLCAEDGRLVSVTAYEGVIYDGVDLIGLTIGDLEEHLGCPADEDGDPVEYDSGEVQVPHEFFDFGLQVWTVDDEVVSVSCLDYREEEGDGEEVEEDDEEDDWADDA
ncbi:MAG: hypothetical protein Kow00114_30420 [Kiloniellaceae bacterium]